MRPLFMLLSPPILAILSIAETLVFLGLAAGAQIDPTGAWRDLAIPVLLGLAGPVLVYLATQRKTGLDGWLAYQEQLSKEVHNLQARLDDVEDEVLAWREWAFELDTHVSKLELAMRSAGLEPPARPQRRRTPRRTDT